MRPYLTKELLMMKPNMKQTLFSVPKPLIQPIERVESRSYPPETEAYFTHYGLACSPDILHWFGSFSSGSYQLAAHLYQPPHPKAAVILLHGYLNHTGQFRHILAYLLENGYAAAVFDLPGHGLSTGQMSRIDHVEEYTHALWDFLTILPSRLNGPYHAIGFSLGAAVLADALLTGQADSFDRVVLAAPLLRWNGYHPSKNTYKIYRRFTDRIRRVPQRNSSDQKYLLFNRTQDYLHASSVSLCWVKALFDWNDKIEKLPPTDKEIFILQGDRDRTVDWRYNLTLLTQKFPSSQLQIIPGARHELFNEAPLYREPVLQAVRNYLQKGAPSFSAQNP